jgi:hypothetical protein
MPSICISDRIIGNGSSPNLRPAKTAVLAVLIICGQRNFIYGFSAESFVKVVHGLKALFFVCSSGS